MMELPTWKQRMVRWDVAEGVKWRKALGGITPKPKSWLEVVCNSAFRGVRLIP
jgi:hypothetical protein